MAEKYYNEEDVKEIFVDDLQETLLDVWDPEQQVKDVRVTVERTDDDMENDTWSLHIRYWLEDNTEEFFWFTTFIDNYHVTALPKGMRSVKSMVEDIVRNVADIKTNNTDKLIDNVIHSTLWLSSSA